MVDLPWIEVPDGRALRKLRQQARLTQQKAANLARLSHRNSWGAAERGQQRIAVANYELFLLAIGRHPRAELIPRRAPTPRWNGKM